MRIFSIKKAQFTYISSDETELTFNTKYTLTTKQNNLITNTIFSNSLEKK